MTIPGITIDPFPEQIDLATLVLSTAGICALIGAIDSRLRGMSREDAAKHTEDFALGGAILALVIFAIVVLVRGVS